ncbi:DUF2218 domain-containing protein [Roseibium sp. RKSG952]|uniref:DUF2218 domain-containing protein n=1 Tax=Roseibium sp. RKSG952 TaxID=2529384 RepID=UPI0012BCC2FC|nr:DUF2218 domain-containing protein [Roseibium sp. RKSG952]MTH98346.1 DUF2218 domain-containing protein [Roseibium sp. RKSG952]
MLCETATVPTTSASKYLQQLCKHFAHKVSVQWDAEKGEVDFPYGDCRIDATDTGLTFSCKAEDASNLSQMKEVIEDHLKRFAWREDLKFSWTQMA